MTYLLQGKKIKSLLVIPQPRQSWRLKCNSIYVDVVKFEADYSEQKFLFYKRKEIIHLSSRHRRLSYQNIILL